ncbi:hypothetical protein AMECASPLE_037847, partial [Ameca splendens]
MEKFRNDFDNRYTYIQDLLNKASALELEFLDDDNTRDIIFLSITAKVEEMAEDDSTLNERLAAEPEGDHQSSHRGDDDKEKEEEAETQS